MNAPMKSDLWRHIEQHKHTVSHPALNDMDMTSFFKQCFFSYRNTNPNYGKRLTDIGLEILSLFFNALSVTLPDLSLITAGQIIMLDRRLSAPFHVKSTGVITVFAVNDKIMLSLCGSLKQWEIFQKAQV